MLIGVQLLLSLMVGLSVLAVVMGVRSLAKPGEADERLEQVLWAGSGTLPTLQQIEMRASFYQRALKPLSRTLLNWLGRLAPQRNIEEIQRKLETAGLQVRLSVVDFLGLKILGSVFLGAVMAALGYLFRPESLLTITGAGVVFGLMGFMLPNFWLGKQVANRQIAIVRALPDALDMMTICVDAGLGLQGAMQKICENWDNALADEFARVMAEVRLGRSRVEALESMGKRTGVKEVLSFVLALTMADKLGVSTAKVLHIQAEQMRVARRQRAEEIAQQASIKMLFPLVFLIFPSMFAVILGPAVPTLMETLLAV